MTRQESCNSYWERFSDSVASIQALFPGMDEVNARLAFVISVVEPGFESEELKLHPAEVDCIIEFRNQARADKDYKTADFLRDVLRRAGVTVKDGK